MKYIQGTIGLSLILSIDKSDNIKWCVEEEFLVQKDIRNHTGGFMTMVTNGAYVRPSKKSLTLRVQSRPSLLGSTMSWHKWYGPNNSWKIKDTRSTTTSSIKIIKAPSNWIRMSDNQVASELATSISGIILSLILSRSRKHMWSFVTPCKLSGITLRKQYRNIIFFVSVVSSLVSMKITFPPKMRPEEHYLKSEK